MHILHYSATYLPSATGVGVAIDGYARIFRAKGDRVFVAAPTSHSANGSAQYTDHPDVLRYLALPNPFNKGYPIGLMPLHPATWRVLTRTKLDIVHVHHLYYFSYLADKIAQYHRCPLIFHYHTRYEMYAKMLSHPVVEPFASRITRNSVAKAVKRADGIVVPSERLAQTLRPVYPQKRIITLPTGHQLASPTQPKDWLRKTYALAQDDVLLLSLSRLSKVKNLSVLIQAMVQLPPQYKLLIVGDGEYRSHLEEEVQQYGVAARVFFAGAVAHEDVVDYYHGADIFVFTSTSETQGLTLLEAQSAGLPAVAVQSDASEEWVARPHGILTDQSAEAFAAGIVQADQVRHDHDVAAALKAFAARYTIESTAQQLRQFYQECIDHKA